MSIYGYEFIHVWCVCSFWHVFVGACVWVCVRINVCVGVSVCECVCVWRCLCKVLCVGFQWVWAWVYVLLSDYCWLVCTCVCVFVCVGACVCVCVYACEREIKSECVRLCFSLSHFLCLFLSFFLCLSLSFTTTHAPLCSLFLSTCVGLSPFRALSCLSLSLSPSFCVCMYVTACVWESLSGSMKTWLTRPRARRYDAHTLACTLARYTYSRASVVPPGAPLCNSLFAVFGSVLQFVAMCCSVLQWVAVCCGLWQCVVDYCSVSYCVGV